MLLVGQVAPEPLLQPRASTAKIEQLTEEREWLEGAARFKKLAGASSRSPGGGQVGYHRAVRCRSPLVLGLLIAPAGAAAQTTEAAPFRLVVSDRPGCPAASDVRADLSHRLGAEALRDDAARELAVDFIPTPLGWDAWIVATDRSSGRRRLRVIERHAARCDQLLDTVGVALAVAFEAAAPASAPAPAVPPPTPRDTVDAERPPVIAPVTAATAVSPEPRPIAASVALLGGVAVGFEATAPTWGIQLRAGPAGVRWLHGVVGFRSVVAFERRDTNRVLGATIGAFGGCASRSLGAFGVAVCAGVELGGVRAIFPEPGQSRGDRLWFAPFASLYGRARVVGPVFLAVEGRVAATVEPEEPRGGDVRRPPPLQPARVTGDVSALVGIDL